MKKISLFFTAALLIVAASCINQELNSDEAQPLKLNITVAGLGGPDTKAAKNAWTEGDKLNCWFDENGVSQYPDLVITYTAGVWKAGSLRDGVTLQENGHFAIAYESTNDLSSYSYTQVPEYGRHIFHPEVSSLSETNTVGGQPCYCRPLIATAPNVSYTYSSNTLTANITDWSVDSKFKVLIKGLPQSELSAADYVLAVDNASQPWTASAGGGFELQNASRNRVEKCPVISGTTNVNNVGMAGGIQEEDGIAFYYNYLWCYNPSDNPTACTVSITLYEGTTAKKSFSKDNVIFDPQPTYCYGVSIDYSKFE